MGNTTIKFSMDMCAILLMIISRLLYRNLSDIQNKFNVEFSKQTIARHLDALSYKLKDSRQKLERANTPEKT